MGHGMVLATILPLLLAGGRAELHNDVCEQIDSSLFQVAAKPYTPPQGHRYVIGGGYTIDSGGSAETSCGDVETLPGGPRLHEITTLEECRIAAKTIGVDITMMVGPGSWNHVPSGCTVLQGDATPESRAVGTSGRVHFSTTSGNNNGGKGGYLLICKQATTQVDDTMPTGGTEATAGKRVAIVVAGSFMRYNLNSTLHHLIRPLVAEGHQADYYVSLTYQSRPAYRSDYWYMQHLTVDPVFADTCGGETNEPDIRSLLNNMTAECNNKYTSFIASQIQKHGGRAGKVVLRNSLSIDDNPLVAAHRSAAMSLRPGEDPDLRFPTKNLGKKQATANANRNMLTLFLNYEQLWDEVVKSEDTTQPYDYVIFLRDDTLWLKDFSLNRLIERGHADLYMLSCDARQPPMWREEVNDHGSVVSRRKAELFGKYFTGLFHADIAGCSEKIAGRTGGRFGCNSEMILKTILTQDGVSTQLVGQGLIPFQRSVHVKMPGGGVAPCFHKYCQSHSDALASFGIQRCQQM